MTEDRTRIRFPAVVDCGAWFDGIPDGFLLDFTATTSLHPSALDRLDELSDTGPVRFLATGPTLDHICRRFGRRLRHCLGEWTLL